MCIICSNEYQGRKTIDCRYCIRLTQIPVIPGLVRLVCNGCKITEIPVIPGLKQLFCIFCTNLKKIPVIPGLEKLVCSECTSLTRIPDIPGLKELSCGRCPRLTQIPDVPWLSCLGSTWLEQNPEFPNNLKILIRLQGLARKWMKLRLLRRWMESEDFAMWYYHPEKPGGLRDKARMRKYFNSLTKN